MGKLNISKINNFEAIRAVQQSEVKKTGIEKTPLSENKKTVDEDRLELSDRASEVGKLVEQIKELPDVRKEKVESLREQISAGDYQPSSEKIADAILKDEQ